MICCATARWKLPTKASAGADKQWLFLISLLHCLFHSMLTIVLLLTIRVE
ncbi:hypothetical protein BDW02DRAFT_494421 [Decorospora gaudefroyi]|uniref:Uncharacterized protein n=1 Tax=Decorospora gaudefroyi TaxID=184978 RepID=A0A6A5KDN7_9PLEO|nr:hypothetical protein BDW02DRAFT_494421 [Decorospora gaudefroyi]